MLRMAFVGCLVLALAPSAHAQDGSQETQARALFEAGRTAYDSGRFEQALRYFQESYELSGRAALLFNIGSAADRLQDNERALESYRAYLAAMPNADNRELTESRIRFLEARIGPRPPPDPEVRVETPDQPVTPPSGGGDVTSEWWFWTLIGVLAAGAIAGAAVAIVLTTSGPEAFIPGDLVQDNGQPFVFVALTERF